MADNKVRKGFLFYIMMLLLLVVATFFVLVVVMIFNPGMNIMGYKYFTTAKEYRISQIKQNDGSFDKIDLSQTTNIFVNSTFSNFEIKRDATVEEVTIEILNHQTGIAKSSQNTEFYYEITYTQPEGSSYKQLNINVKNAEGFIYFSDQCDINILIPESTVVNSASSLNVSLDKGTINIARKELLNEVASYINIDNLNLSTGDGNINLGKYSDATFDKFVISQKNGTTTVPYNINLNSNGEISFIGNNAGFDFENITFIDFDNTKSILDINLNNSNLFINNAKANIHINAVNSLIKINETFEGNMESNDLVNNMDKMDLQINTIIGTLSLPFANNCDITIEDASQAKLFISSKNADVNIKKISTNSWIECDEGTINVSLNQAEGIVNLRSKKGEINVDYSENVLLNLIVKNLSGKTNLNYYPTSSFVLEFYNSAEEERNNDIYVEGYEDIFSNPLNINKGGKVTQIYGDGTIAVNTIKNIEQ